MPTSPATRAALWALGSPHARLCSSGFMALAGSLQLTEPRSPPPYIGLFLPPVQGYMRDS